ncbi:hypothetical protein DSL72_005986 [Monilinia vaccinii-corymbosi]|uniref:N-acetyltransferase domain-containing protein n=1 Tax=Monilinia vaccinii-corymbosi TaxID=61207 RepID=A0A8A3PH92_9HELO|nr:hypothetical protein DSL72_005986 [Monilinia vaccinii-corymbosi]
MAQQNAISEVQKPPEAKVLRYHTVREARYEDIPLLEDVERSADTVFKDVCFEDSLMDPVELLDMLEDYNLWVAVDFQDNPVGFICGFELDGLFHVERLAVARKYQRQGIGAALMDRMTSDVKEQGYRAITLTTTMTFPFQGPWYQTLGFFKLEDQDVGFELDELIQSQSPDDMSNCIPWCPMRKNIS